MSHLKKWPSARYIVGQTRSNGVERSSGTWTILIVIFNGIEFQTQGRDYVISIESSVFFKKIIKNEADNSSFFIWLWIDLTPPYQDFPIFWNFSEWLSLLFRYHILAPVRCPVETHKIPKSLNLPYTCSCQTFSTWTMWHGRMDDLKWTYLKNFIIKWCTINWKCC